jgi:hypothetical protein
MLPCSQMACINFMKTHHFSPNPTSLCSSSSRTTLVSHTLMCSACSPDAPAARPFQSLLTTALSSPSLGTLSRMSTLLTWMGRSSPREGTLPYNATRSAVWAASNMGLAVGVRLDEALYHPFMHRHASFLSPPARCPLIFSATVAARCFRLPVSPVLICHPMRQAVRCGSFPCGPSVALLSMSAQVGAEIQELHGCARLGGATTSSQSSSNREQSSV